jgi:hypothetical protein
MRQSLLSLCQVRSRLLKVTYDLDGLAVLRGEGGEVTKDLAGLQLLLEHVTEPKLKISN